MIKKTAHIFSPSTSFGTETPFVTGYNKPIGCVMEKIIQFEFPAIFMWARKLKKKSRPKKTHEIK